MTKLLSNENFINLLCVVMFVFSIFAASLSVALYHQYQIIYSRYIADQYDKKTDLLNIISLDVQLITMCQNETNQQQLKENVNEHLQSECLIYIPELNGNLRLLSQTFKLDNQQDKKVSEIINRKNQQTLDQKSILSINQVLDTLQNQLAKEDKPRKLPSYF